jgi:hypothetical protein
MGSPKDLSDLSENTVKQNETMPTKRHHADHGMVYKKKNK